ncbi:MAG: FAD-dependent oxidoreductase [Actinophytocola sp.]|uniref:2Fe-2S iron-sulfur cluster-binding protein n=1 Tax=Actinophytocola sp. TaxID=1872138 RepID=UPI001323D7CB|nr:2Fe-2S iron-sulfur cluster-binding protein [Actinophytocola sp.]MPZ85813.1 FAD-dependent oxidoreductase [Actinophytocola sp.]
MRVARGGRIDRSAPLRFTVDGVSHIGYRGDTVASALLANGVRRVGDSIHLGRPRGIVDAGVAEPNALLQVGAEPMLAATTVELYDGLVAETLSGRGRLVEPDSGEYDKKYRHCDALVVGAGPAGLVAALAAGRSGARVILADEQAEPGGSLLSTPDRWPWLAQTLAELAGLEETRVLTRATVFGYYDHNHLTIAERRPGGGRLWHVRASHVILATGAHERPLVFANNDRPGVMLASAVRTYLNRYAVRVGSRAVVCTTNDSAYGTALDLLASDVDVLVADTREGSPLADRVRAAGGEVRFWTAVVGTEGDPEVTAAHLGSPDGTGPVETVPCDLVAVSGGWNPVVHLHSQARGTLRYDESLGAFVPDRAVQAHVSVGSANGELDPNQPLWTIPAPGGGWDTHFVDPQRDATVADVLRATGAGMRSAEHVKRYTTIGTAHDQGKTAGVTTLGVIAEALGAGPPGPTTFRPPYTPVPFAMLAGRDRDALHDPVRVTPIHSWHVEHGAEFENVGQWKRPWFYPRDGEDMTAAVLRECRAARTGVGMQDASTLGKIEIVGPDAAEFLNRMYTNAFAKLAVGSARYGMLCTADGMVFDDGVVLRLAADHFLATTTTGNAAAVLDWFEEWLQTEWPDLRVHLTSVTEQWATIAVVGPLSRKVVATLAPAAVDLAFMTFLDTELANGVPARIARISFSGELAFEVNVASWYGLPVWRAVLAAGEAHGITPYGTETMHVLRAEKGYPIVGQDTDGTVTPIDLGMDWVVSKRKQFVGRRSLQRPDTARPDRKQLVGLLPVDPSALLPEGAQLVAADIPLDVPLNPPVPMLGHVTSSYRSAALGRTFALALVKSGRDRLGQVLHAPLGDRTIAATVTEPVLYDPEGARRDG